MSTARSAALRETSAWRVALFAAGLTILLWLVLWGASLLSDNGRIPSELAAAAQQPGDMVCADGAIVRGDGSFVDSLFSTGGRFRCTDWRMRHPRVDPSTGKTDWPSSPLR
ncbi:MAG TPA: hypothetical protein VFF72_09050 [Caldimonas sp.]|nr:hypothetical protein [Caldimonas sp.]